MKLWLFHALLAGAFILAAIEIYLTGYEVAALALGIAGGYEYGLARSWSGLESTIEPGKVVAVLGLAACVLLLLVVGILSG